MIISLGLQCTNATLIKKNQPGPRLPFDWMFATPNFVYNMLYLLLEENLDIEELVEKHFLNISKKAYLIEVEKYETRDDGYALYNTTYSGLFPHDKEYFNNKQDIINKYVRRFERLKKYILQKEEKICFIYSSQSSLGKGNLLIDNVEIIKDVYVNLSKIYNLISKYNNNFKFVVFDTIKQEDKNLLHENIKLIELNSCNNYTEVLEQMKKYVDILLN